jgi:hypothetical protein
MARGTRLRNLEFGGPAWLWEQLCYRKRTAAGDSRVDTCLTGDSLFEEVAAEWHAFYIDDTIANEVAAYLFPPFWNATTMWSATEPGALRWVVEALILAEQNDKDIAAQLGPEEDPSTIAVYRRLFFDVEAGRHSLAWMTKYVWEPGMARSGRLYMYDYCYKTAALYGGLAVFNNILLPAVSDPDSEKWLYGFLNSERRKLLLNTAGNSAKLPTAMLLPAHEMAISKWLDVKATAGGLSGDTGKSLETLMSLVADETRISNMETRMGRQEIVDIEKYKDGEL